MVSYTRLITVDYIRRKLLKIFFRTFLKGSATHKVDKFNLPKISRRYKSFKKNWVINIPVSFFKMLNKFLKQLLAKIT